MRLDEVIDLSSEMSLKTWAAKLNVHEVALREAVGKVGVMPIAVACYLQLLAKSTTRPTRRTAEHLETAAKRKVEREERRLRRKPDWVARNEPVGILPKKRAT